MSVSGIWAFGMAGVLVLWVIVPGTGVVADNANGWFLLGGLRDCIYLRESPQCAPLGYFVRLEN